MKLLAIVGADGTGKTTQARRLASRLEATGYRTRLVRPAFVLFDPWRLRNDGTVADALSPRILRIGSEGNGETARPRSPLALFAIAGYLYALATYAFLRIAYRGAHFVVCDRYFYQFFFDVSGPLATRFAESFPRPDLVVWLDADIAAIRSRISDRPEGTDAARYLETAVGYHGALAAALAFVRIDAGSDADAVGEAIWRTVTERVLPCAG